MLFQDFWPSRAKIFTSPPSPSLLISNFWIAFDVQTYFLIFTYSTVTDPLPGDLIMEDIDLGPKKCAKPNFSFRSQKSRVFSIFTHSIDVSPLASNFAIIYSEFNGLDTLTVECVKNLGIPEIFV